MRVAQKGFFMIVCLLLVVTAFATSSFAVENVSDEEKLTIVDGRLSDEGAMYAIDEYLNSKTINTSELTEALRGDVEVSAMNAPDTTTSTFVIDAMNRNIGFHDFESALNVKFVNVDIKSVVDEIIAQNENAIMVDVYESTLIEYYASEEAETTDVMGYSTAHLMVLEMIDGQYQVVSDSYDERFITGVCSNDLTFEPIFSESVETSSLTTEAEFLVPTAVSDVSTYGVGSVIGYANEWCGVAGAKSFLDSGNGVYEPEEDDSRYNSLYYHPAQSYADCANFVSQCLFAGGLVQNDTWKPHTVAWNTAKGLHLYLRDTMQCTIVAATSDTVFPGNPVYWWNGPENNVNDNGGLGSTGHQMICTGYNAAGVPVLNGHTNNMFRVPMTFSTITVLANQGSGLKTAQIVTSNQHNHSSVGYTITPTEHYKKCTICRNITIMSGAHIVVTSSSGQYCRICKYTGPFGSVINGGEVIFQE